MLTTPCDSTPEFERDLVAAARAAGFNVLRLVKEPVAAVMAYGLGMSNVDGLRYSFFYSIIFTKWCYVTYFSRSRNAEFRSNKRPRITDRRHVHGGLLTLPAKWIDKVGCFERMAQFCGAAFTIHILLLGLIRLLSPFLLSSTGPSPLSLPSTSLSLYFFISCHLIMPLSLSHTRAHTLTLAQSSEFEAG